MADPDRMYPLLQLYVTVPSKVVLDGVPEVPSEMEGGELQSTATCMKKAQLGSNSYRAHNNTYHS